MTGPDMTSGPVEEISLDPAVRDRILSDVAEWWASQAPDAGGVWFVYGWDMSAYPLNVFASEIEARRWADRVGYGEVRWWPFGTEWTDLP